MHPLAPDRDPGDIPVRQAEASAAIETGPAQRTGHNLAADAAGEPKSRIAKPGNGLPRSARNNSTRDEYWHSRVALNTCQTAAPRSSVKLTPALAIGRLI
jgi:hypothetical protein